MDRDADLLIERVLDGDNPGLLIRRLAREAVEDREAQRHRIRDARPDSPDRDRHPRREGT